MEDFIIRVKDVTIRFALASEKIDSMKDYVIKRLRGVISYDEFFAITDTGLSGKQTDRYFTVFISIMCP